MTDPIARAIAQALDSKMKRRDIFRLAGATAVASATTFSPLMRTVYAKEKMAASKVIAGKSDAMIVHNDRTGVLETPLDLLREHQITPPDILYVRNNQIKEPEGRTLDGVPLEGWMIDLGGTVAFPRVIDASMLAGLPQTEVTMVLQCSGNGRSFYARTVKTRGTQWAHGGMGNVTFAGPKLTDVLGTFDPPLNPRSEVRFVTAEGADKPPEGGKRPDFEHSLPLDDVMDRAILAIRMNGAPLPGAHGGPVRLVVPGYYGTMNVKWLSRLRFDVEQTNNVNQIPRYRIPNDPIEPGTPIKYTFENSTPDWRQRIKSVIFTPSNEASVAAGQIEVTGMAWSGNPGGVTAVHVTTNEGVTWHRAGLKSAHGEYGWHEFQIRVTLPAGKHRIWSRAFDPVGNAQPLNGSIRWNPSGYEWHGADYVDVSVS